jgi:hypothetical protein
MARSFSPSISTDVVGQGGYGVVVENGKRHDVVHKLMKTHVGCAKAMQEYVIHQMVYDTCKAFVTDHPSLKSVIAVPKPILYFPCQESCRSNECFPCGPPYHCMYSMEKVVSGRRDGLMRHVLLNTDSEGFTGKIHFVSTNASPVNNSTYVNNVTKQLAGPRGAFLGVQQLQGHDPKNLARSMGILFELIITAGAVPMDVEYVLGMPPGSRAKVSIENAKCMYVMDFGMSNQADFDFELDMYLPQESDPEMFQAFTEGRGLVANWAKERTSRRNLVTTKRKNRK